VACLHAPGRCRQRSHRHHDDAPATSRGVGLGLLAAILFPTPGAAVISTSGVVTAPDGTSMPVQFMPASVTVR
jgi:hypothetical protein